MKREDSIRKQILFTLYAVRPTAFLVSTLTSESRKQRLDFTEAEIRRECSFLADTGLIIEITDPGSTQPLYRIHANGTRHYEQTYAA